MADGQSSQGALGSPAGGSPDSGGDQSPRSSVREQDRFLPIANISRIMKKALPANGKIAKDAKETVQECVSEFISFITSEASDKCQREKRKTINGDDLLWAMATLGFEEYIDPLKVYLARYREVSVLILIFLFIFYFLLPSMLEKLLCVTLMRLISDFGVLIYLECSSYGRWRVIPRDQPRVQMDLRPRMVVVMVHNNQFLVLSLFTRVLILKA
ncbi:nuclear transcription factor Y subunit B-10 isoform X1 [Andrographis paniculata]|uniref:nuclear transcription factor Y subunit B-10 isoform X1 n=1 Tax=Andrographis paniculata TaxID=175694 RepID=UPI0021E914D6|nr:nuclear transcription factor Y subunit B-10 isoform X1 [Andrographis paniculata]XP_051132330.1 nuclear transcription factor Y subunit B-10 isoform X1 [Andrographis paniculata]